MEFDTTWQELCDQCRAVDADAVLVTPASDRAFAVESVREDCVAVRFLDGDRARALWRDQFEVLSDRLETESDGISLADLPTGVEPYVSVLSLSSRYGVDESANVLRRAEDDATRESPFLEPAWSARSRPERIRDDAILLSDALGRHDLRDLASLPPERLVDLYVLLSDVQRGADRYRRDVGDVLLEYVGPDARLHGRFGTVHRTTRERRRLRDEQTVLDALDGAGIPREWVYGVDEEKLDVVLAVTDLEESAVYDVDQQVYVQKTAVEEAEKQSRLQGLKDRLDALDADEAAALREDIEAIEDRIDAALATG
jgi:hypothetical protein